MTHPANPYPGPRSFQPGEKLYGRRRETWELLDLLIAERIVLLYSPSGAGKTSLIQAALVPELEKEGYRVLHIMRPGLEPEEDVTADNRYILSLLLSLEKDLSDEEKTPLAELAQMTLAEYLENRTDWRGENKDEEGDGGRDAWYGDVLIFDQFEEVLTVDPTDREAKIDFFRQVGQVLRSPHHWALFSMREEFVAGLDPYLRLLPTRLSATYRLDLLGVDAAKAAIQKPARTVNRDFTDAAAQQLVDDLRVIQVQQPDGSMRSTLGLYIEPVQLQVVCRRLWDRAGVLDDNAITVDDLDDVGGVDQALRAYYADRIAVISAETNVRERVIREWMGQKLITEWGFRGQVLKGVESSEGLCNQAIQKLEDAHLVRADSRRGATWFELAHDRLIMPVRKDNAAWFLANLNEFQRRAARWDRHHDPGLLLKGRDLADAASWAETHPDELEEYETEFLKASQAVREQEQELNKSEQQRRRLWKVLGAGLIAVLLLAVGLWSFSQKAAQFLRDRNESESLRLVYQARTLLEEGDIPGALLLSIEADKVTSTLQTQGALLAALDAAYAPHGKDLHANPAGDDSPALGWSSDYPVSSRDRLVKGVSPDVGVLVVQDGALIRWERAESGTPISATLSLSTSHAITMAAIIPQQPADESRAFTPTPGAPASWVATIDERGKLALWLWPLGANPDTLQALDTPDLADDERATALAFSPDGQRLAVAICTGVEDQGTANSPCNAVLRIWEVAAAPLRLRNPENIFMPARRIIDLTYGGDIHTLAWIDDRYQLYLGDPTKRLRDRKRLTPGPTPNQELAPQDRVLAYIQDGDWLASGGCMFDSRKGCQNGFVRLWHIPRRIPFGPILKTTARDVRDLAVFSNPVGLAALGVTGETGKEGELIQWALGSSKINVWRDLACLKAGRNLTYPEWQEALPDRDYPLTCEHYGVHLSVALAGMAAGDDMLHQCDESATRKAMKEYEKALVLAGERASQLPYAQPQDRAIERLIDETWRLINEGAHDASAAEMCFEEANRLLANGGDEASSDMEAAIETWGEMDTIAGDIRSEQYENAWRKLDRINEASSPQPAVVADLFTRISASAYQALCFSSKLPLADHRNACAQLAKITIETSSIGRDEPVTSATDMRSLWVFAGDEGDIVSIEAAAGDTGFDPDLTLRGEDGRTLATDEDGGDATALIEDYFLPEAGRYFIQVGPDDAAAPYTLTVRSRVPEPIGFGETITSSTAVTSLWVLEGHEGDIVTIAMDAIDPEFDPYLTLMDGANVVLVEDDDGGGSLNARINDFQLPGAAVYIRTGRPNSDVPYTLSVRESVYGLIVPGKPVTSTTEIQRLWLFKGEEGDIVTIAMDAIDYESEFDPYLRLTGPDGADLTEDDDGGGGLNARIQDFVLPVSGEYRISAQGLGASGAYRLSLSQGKAGSLAMNESVQSTTQEKVLWSFMGRAGDLITIELSGATESFDPYLTLMDGAGLLLAENDDSGEGWNGYDARIQGFVLPESGSFFVRAGRAGSSEPYTLSLASELPLTVTLPATLDLSAGIAWAFDGREGQLASIRVEQDGEGERPSPQMHLSIPGGEPVIPQRPAMLLPLPATTTYTLVVTGGSSEPGIQFLTMEEITATLHDLTYSHPVSGRVGAGVTDYWSFIGDASQAVAINVTEGSERVFMELYGPDGGLLRTYDGSDPANDASLISSVPLTGTYYLTVRGLEPETVGPYALDLERTDTVPIPQACDASAPESAADYGPIRVGSRVILGRHTPVNGSTNWASPMEQYVGEQAEVTGVSGVDGDGCPTVSVDIDGGDWIWRIRDMTFIP